MDPDPGPVPAPHHSLDIAVLVRGTQELLAAGIPLTLLMDLGETDGPHSRHAYRTEGGEDAAWLPRPRES